MTFDIYEQVQSSFNLYLLQAFQKLTNGDLYAVTFDLDEYKRVLLLTKYEVFPSLAVKV